MIAITPNDALFVALHAKRQSTIADVFCETNLAGLAAMIRGGLLASDIILISDDRDATHDRAVSELQLHGGGK